MHLRELRRKCRSITVELITEVCIAPLQTKQNGRGLRARHKHAERARSLSSQSRDNFFAGASVLFFSLSLGSSTPGIRGSILVDIRRRNEDLRTE